MTTQSAGEDRNLRGRTAAYKRSIQLPERLRDAMFDLAYEHERTFSEEVRHALRLYVALSERQRDERRRAA